MSGYSALLRDPSVARPFVSSVVARIPIATAPLGLVLLVRDQRDSYSLAGVVTGLFAVGLALGSPFWGRALDRLGQPRVLVHRRGQRGAAAAADGGHGAAGGPRAGLPVLSLLAGAAFPPLSPAMRSTWRVVVLEERARRRGYALDAAAVETMFVGGPLLLSGFCCWVAALPLLVTVLLLVGGTMAYVRSPGARRAPAGPPRRAARGRSGAAAQPGSSCCWSCSRP